MNTYYIVKAVDHDQKFGAGYNFTQYGDRERAGRVAAKMASRVGVAMTVIRVEKRGGFEVMVDEGTYGPGPQN